VTFHRSGKEIENRPARLWQDGLERELGIYTKRVETGEGKKNGGLSLVRENRRYVRLAPQSVTT